MEQSLQHESSEILAIDVEQWSWRKKDKHSKSLLDLGHYNQQSDRPDIIIVEEEHKFEQFDKNDSDEMDSLEIPDEDTNPIFTP